MAISYFKCLAAFVKGNRLQRNRLQRKMSTTEWLCRPGATW